MKNVLKLMAKKFAEDVEAYVEAHIKDSVAEIAATLEAKYAKAIEKKKVVKLPKVRTGGYKFDPKPCPVCGVLNRSRRTSFYCKAHENLRPLKVKEAAIETVPSAETVA